MMELMMMIGWIVGLVLAVMWLFLPWLIIAKLDEVIAELKKINTRNG